MKTFLILFLALPLACLAGQPFLVNSPKPVVSGGGGGGYALVQSGASTSRNVVLGSSVTAGNCLVVICTSIGGVPIASVANVAGDTFVLITNAVCIGDYGPTTAAFLALNCAGGANSANVTCAAATGAYGSGYECVTVIEYSGVTAAGVADSQQTQYGADLSVGLTTSATGFFVGAITADDFSSSSATLNSVSGTSIASSLSNTHRVFAVYGWLATSAGYPADSYAGALHVSNGGCAGVLFQLK